jgi:glutamine amidotransferase
VTGRFNFLLTDGQVIAATAAGDTLWYRPELGVVVASEPGDDEPGWIQVPPDSVITATQQQVSVADLGRITGSGLETRRTGPGRQTGQELAGNPGTADGRIPIR